MSWKDSTEIIILNKGNIRARIDDKYGPLNRSSVAHYDDFMGNAYSEIEVATSSNRSVIFLRKYGIYN